MTRRPLLTASLVPALGLVCASVLVFSAAASARRAHPPQAGLEHATPGFTPEHLHRLAWVGDVHITADASRIAYIAFSSQKSGAPAPALWVLDVASGTHTEVAGSAAAPASPRWSPDGRWLAFLGRADGRPSLLVIRADEEFSEPEPLATLSSVNHPFAHTGEAFAWSSGSSRLAYVTGMPGPGGDHSSGDPAVITRYLYKPATGEGPGRFNDNRRLQLFMVDLVSRQPQQLTDEAAHIHSLSWSPTSDDILFAANAEPDADRTHNDDVFVFNVAKRAWRQLTKTPGVEYDPAWAPDGRSITFRATTRARTSSETQMEDTHVWTMKADGTGRQEVGATIDNRQGAPRFAPDGQAVYFTVQERGDVRLYRQPVGPGTPDAVAPPRGEPGTVTAWSFSKTGRLAFAMGTPESPAQLYVRDPGGPARQVTTLNAAWLPGVARAAVERFSFKGDGDLDVEAFVTKPVLAAGTRAPVIVIVHGGPHGQQGPGFSPKAQVYAERGWASLMVNYRGSTGYGQAFADVIRGDQNGAETRDVLKGLDAALARFDWLDGTKVGIEGSSYGGQIANWLVTQTDRFRAAVSIAGISNLVSFNYTAYYHDYLAVEFGGFPHERDLMDVLFQRSPIRHVGRVKTPVLLMHGELDHDVPIGESEQFYIALKDVGVETALVRYPREGHGLREVRHQVDALQRSTAWFATHFAAAAARPPTPGQ